MFVHSGLPGLLQKVGAPRALKGLFVTGSLAWGGGKGRSAGAAAGTVSMCVFRQL